MALFKVFDTAGNPVGEYPSHAKLLMALKRFEPDGSAWVEDEQGRRSLYLISSVGITHLSPHVVDVVQRELKQKLEVAAQDAIDAKKWRTLMSSGRIRTLGCAGLLPEHPSYETPYAHMGLEIWNIYKGCDPKETETSRRYLEAYVEKMDRCPAIIQTEEA